MIRRLQPLHRARRLFDSLSPRPPRPEDEHWASELLGPTLAPLFAAMAPLDRRHSIAVARAVRSSLTAAGRDPDHPGERWITEAALLHDAGKAGPALGIPLRVVATCLEAALPARARDRVGGRVGAYLRYPRTGAALLQSAGADPRVSAWAAEHHEPPGRWTVDWGDGRLLRNADDGRD